MSEDIMAGVKSCVAESLGAEIGDLKPSTRLIDDLDADSLDIMDLMFQLEEKFEVKMDKEDFNFLTKIDMERDQAVQNDFLTLEAKKKLASFLYTSLAPFL